MEKLLSDDDRIRRAEEIYYRRKTGDNTTRYSSDRKEKEKHPIKKMIDIIMVCLVFYTAFYAIQNKDYIFTQEFLEDTNKLVSVDIKEKIINFTNGIKSKIENNQTSENVTSENIVENNEINQTSGNTTENVSQNTNAISNTFIEATLSMAEDVSSIDQMRIDADEIKDKFIKPIDGEVTSEFGVRDLKSIQVSKYHTGLDIAANSGDAIASAISGEVTEVSSYGAYGNHLKIVDGDITIMYAHCSSILVEKGDIVNQGDIIARVGSTGNSTGPHLHFEITKADRYIDPQYILDY